MAFEKLGKTTKLRVAPDYHRLRCRELDMTAEYLEVLARQKDHERAERDRLREDRRAQEELARERAKLEKEQRLYSNQLNALRAAGSSGGADADDLQERLAALEQAISTIDYRASNLRAGYVYVISNIGAFGDRVVQIGLTRRFDPNERIRELGNNAVPFRYDIHAMFFADDAIGFEEEMHRRLADKRVNKVNQRREFFYATPTEVREHLESLTGELVDFKEIAEAVEYRQSRTARDNTPQ
ncbi:GIY-YIG nuclease family protein [Nocardia sp. NPDC058705]|uniref:GIY-YIG nuclease family protein n=1 Tax=Nocardia sp. NPDC058705 TaxID=3346609 RepID=UPI0036AC22DB